MSFVGTGITWIGAQNELCGKVDVYLDGAYRRTVNPYYGKWGYDKAITVVEDLPRGSHTLRLVNTGLTNGVRAYMFLQGFRVHDSKPAFSAAPNCENCHSQHGDLTIRHQTTSDVAGCVGAGCHRSPELSVEHDQWWPTGTCELCHSATASAEVSQAVAAGDTSCAACHDLVSGPTHRTAHWPTPMLSDELGPRYGYYTGSASLTPTNDCLGCHTSNLVDEHMGMTDGPYVTRPPRYDSAGNALDCASCHSSSKFEVLNAIATGTSACETCHAVHAPIPETHASEFTPDTDASCAECHSSDLAVVHNGNYSVTTASGKVLTGCAVCHEYFEGERGAQVQYAIEVANDTDCTACHADYHTGATPAHTADDSASVACADCHGTVGQPLSVTDVHAGAALGTCAVCHNNPARVPDLSAKTAECASCHATSGTDYHTAMAGAHTYTEMPAGCVGANCHAANTLPEAHSAYLSRYPDYATTCALCHQNADPLRINWETASADCSTCHTVHADVNAVHTATAPERCFTCHKTADAFAIHKDRVEGACAVCHANPTKGDLAAGKLNTNCDGCHTTEGTDFHAGMNAKHQGLSGTSGCDVPECHGSIYVPQIHERFVGSGTEYPQYADSCELCHLNDSTTRINWTTAVNGACSNCHAYPQHQTSNHTATSAESTECVACHGSNWVPIVHDPSQQWEQCNLCHYNPEKGDLTWGKTDSDCEQCHNKYPAATNHYAAADHTATEASDCAGCHKLELAPEHIKASSNAVDCLGCHTSALFSGMTKPWDDTCAACHAAKHGDQSAKHTSTTTACGGAGCHDLTDVSAIHADSAKGCSACHTNDTAIATSTTCTDCHNNATGYHLDQTTSHTATSSAFCERCHDEDASVGVNVEPVHDSVCDTCHNNPTRVADISATTAECGSCHATSGTDYHTAMDTKHTFGAMDASCIASGCHVATTLPEEHARFAGATGRYAEYEDSCALCHENANSTRIDWSTASADCSTCHTVHGDVDAIHAAPESQACVDCHETASVLELHGTSRETSCAYCHNATTVLPTSTKCVLCHDEYTTIDPAHYPVASHDATAETGCGQCHYKDMKAEHFKPTVAVSCVSCHEVKVDSFTSAWDKTCGACHPTKHGERQTKHVSPTTSCGGTGCHDITDVAVIHGVVGGPGCGACHVNPATPATTTNCTAAGCHASVGTDHHAAHNATSANPTSCKGCHFMYLDDEHAALGLTCATCHSSTNTVVQNAITAGDLKCLTCHADSPHNARQGYEFNPKSSSVHRVSSDLPGMQSAFTVNGTRYTWTLPSAASFLKTGWAVDSVMTCESCHTYTGSTGPHGSAMKVNIDPAYPTAYSSGTLSPSTSVGMTTGIICAKCHDLNGTSGSWSNIVHKEHDDRGMTEGGRCVSCHTLVPHGWKRPRLLGSTGDAAGYATVSGGNVEFKLRSYTPSSWSKSDCYAACSSERHPNQSNPWPLVLDPTVPVSTTGDVAGTVTDSATSAAVSGATVSVAGKTATTAADGTYSITGITGGSYTMTVVKTGYTTWSGSVTITNGTTLSKNVSLVAGTSSGTNLALGKTFTASRYESSSYTPAKAGDGSETTLWWSNDTGGSGTTEWLRVDLGSSMTISKTDIAWYGDYWAKEFRVYASTNGYSWTQVYATSSGVAGTSNVTFTARSARYVKVECRKTGTGRGNGYGIAELRVFQ
ncbi:MAG: discoidin domain-containing protein [Coriobacteriia bacterium]